MHASSAARLTLLSTLLAASAACGWGIEQPVATAVVDPLLAAPPVDAPADPSLPDVVLITLDTTRADHLGLYGYFRDTSPTLDALGERSLVFDRLVVPMATTLPTHTSILTGTWPTEHGILANVVHGGDRFVPSDQLTSLAAHLASRGYQTGGFVSAAPLARGTGIEAGFQVYTDPKRMERSGDATVDDATAWLSTTAPSPLLLWVHFYDPHNPFTPPPAYRDLFEADDALDAWIDDRKIARLTKRPTGQPVRAKPSINAYDAEIRFMDDQLARLLAALEARGRLDQTLLVVMGDHGEGLNQHGQPGHGLVWGEQLHAPLLISAPGVAPARVPTVLSAADVLPTALSLVTLPDEDTLLAQVSGRDVLATDFEPRPVLSQTSARQLEFGRDMTYALTDATTKCTWAKNATPQLFLLDVDPHELNDVAAAQPERTEACVAELTRVLAEQTARAAALGSGRTEKMSTEQVQALEALGYLDDDAVPAAEPTP